MDDSNSRFDQVFYYNDRAEIYDQTAGYKDKIAESLRVPLKQMISQYFKTQRVYEVACGTGYWTEIIAHIASSVTAIDLSDNMVKIARHRCSNLSNVEIIKGDFYRQNLTERKFNGAFHHFWFSHIPKIQIIQFINKLHSQLQKNSVIIMSDNIIHDTYPSFVNQSGDRYEVRSLPNKKQYQVIKNLYSADMILNIFKKYDENITVQVTGDGKMWIAVYYLNNL